MRPIDERAIRASFRNASRKEISSLTLPADFAELDFDRLDYLGWYDPKMPRRAYVVAEVDGEPMGVLLQRAEQRTARRAQCSWCDDVTLRNDRKSTRLNSSHVKNSYAVFCLKKKI